MRRIESEYLTCTGLTTVGWGLVDLLAPNEHLPQSPKKYFQAYIVTELSMIIIHCTNTATTHIFWLVIPLCVHEREREKR